MPNLSEQTDDCIPSKAVGHHWKYQWVNFHHAFEFTRYRDKGIHACVEVLDPVLSVEYCNNRNRYRRSRAAIQGEFASQPAVSMHVLRDNAVPVTAPAGIRQPCALQESGPAARA